MSIFFIIGILAIVLYVFLQSAVFGANPDEKSLTKIKLSKNFKDGIFQNQSLTEVSPPGTSYFKVLKDFMNKPKDTEPAKPIHVVKTDLKNYNPSEPGIIWFGHSSYILFIDGKKILVDPVFNRASPIPFFGKPFDYTYNYSASDLPDLDLIIISHDHYDHLDYQTILKLIPKTKHFVAPLGVDAHLIAWGVLAEKITTLDWYENFESDGISITATPARHFSGRKFSRGNTLWSSFVLKTDSLNIYLGGDSGFDKHFKQIGENYGPFDLAILECGQYGKDWPLIHMFPEEVAIAAQQLNAKALLPVHWAKFSLALHSWTDPIEKLLNTPESNTLNIQTPQIGELLHLEKMDKKTRWWRN